MEVLVHGYEGSNAMEPLIKWKKSWTN